ncbi:EAL domain-containing protein [Virgisporangium aliadipatigenens]|uniref:EAL domain-containing protein n=1 Tax=Virgisporangium aliadipatigenens TaxID=741659 RepID=UPI0019425998|nr:EAL domain-containing protein [Virgisporangium aliadipatigenens]
MAAQHRGGPDDTAGAPRRRPRPRPRGNARTEAPPALPGPADDGPARVPDDARSARSGGPAGAVHGTGGGAFSSGQAAVAVGDEGLPARAGAAGGGPAGAARDAVDGAARSAPWAGDEVLPDWSGMVEAGAIGVVADEWPTGDEPADAAARGVSAGREAVRRAFDGTGGESRRAGGGAPRDGDAGVDERPAGAGAGPAGGDSPGGERAVPEAPRDRAAGGRGRSAVRDGDGPGRPAEGGAGLPDRESSGRGRSAAREGDGADRRVEGGAGLRDRAAGGRGRSAVRGRDGAGRPVGAQAGPGERGAGRSGSPVGGVTGSRPGDLRDRPTGGAAGSPDRGAGGETRGSAGVREPARQGRSGRSAREAGDAPLSREAPAARGAGGAAAVDGVLRRWGWAGVAAAGVPVGFMAGFLPDPVGQLAGSLGYLVALGFTSVALFGRRPDELRGWILIVLGRASWVGAAVYWNGIEAAAGGPAQPSWTGVAFLAQYPLLAAGFVVIARARGGDPPGAAVDATLVTGVAAIPAWMFVVGPFVRTPGVSPVEIAAGCGYVLLGLVVMAATLRLVGFGRRPPAAHVLLAGGASALVVGDLTYVISVLGGGFTDFASGRTPDVLWMLAAFALAGAALHPAAEPERRAADPAWSRRRLMVFASLAVAVPIVPVLVPGAPPGTVIPALLGAAVGLLLVVRLGTVASLLGRASADLAHLDALRDELRHRATHDPLTGLASRSALLTRLGAGARDGDLLLLDLDGFAEVNDAHGHVVGDALLMEAAGRLRAALGGARLIARPGGDEFAAIFPPGEGEAAARRALAALRPPYRINERELVLTASAGLVTVRAGGQPAAALRDADLALYAAKAAGRDRVMTFRPELRAKLIRRNELAEGLRHALKRGELELHYQPVVELATGRMVAAEGLLRWRRPDGERVSPVEFIPVAEQTGLIVPIGWWILTCALAQVRGWYDRYGVAVTVNLSAHQLHEADFADRVLAAMESAGVPGRALIIELTESTLITDAGTALDDLRRLRTHGVRIAVDDFGTGYSSLSYLMTLPVDVLKLDRSFTVGKGRQRHVTGAVLQLAAGLDLVTIAEGVETPDQAAALLAQECPWVQGYLYAAAVPPERVTELMRMWNGPPAS